jgi:TRAP-type C4-dicarboxylate transport system permease small subunit
MSLQSGMERVGPYGPARRIIELWALAGGLLLLGVVCMIAYSLLSDIAFRKPLSGDFELVEVGVAVAAFAFLPYCQLTGANVSADIFTQGAGPRTIAFLSLLSAVIALVFSLILTWRMSVGLLDIHRYGETTTIMGFPIWIAYVPIVFSLVLLALASLISVRDALADTRSARAGVPAGRGPAA